jgi:hypothetical protein
MLPAFESECERYWAEAYDIIYVGESNYTLQKGNGNCLSIAPDGTLSFALEAAPYNVYSVIYNN